MKENRRADFALFAVTIALLAIGIFMVYDASYATASQMNKNPEFYRNRQAVFAVVGLIAMFVMMNVRYWWFKKHAGTILVIGIIMLVLVFIPHVGKAANGKLRWLGSGPIQIQPSEFAKLCLVIYLAAVLSRKNNNIRDLQNGLLPLAVPVGIVGALIVVEDMGTAIVVLVTALAMVYAAGARRTHVLGALVMCGVIGLGLAAHESYRSHRLMSYLDPFKEYSSGGYQICQSLIGLGSGGVFGMGICEGREKLFFLPEAHTDFIYSVFGQETGLIGSVCLALLFLFFAYRGFSIARDTRDPFGRLLATGLSALIAGQALLNMLVVTASVPTTGVPLPFISYGGSSLMLNLMSVGVLLGISRYPKPTE